MFRFYVSSQYRKTYNQLTNMQVLNDSMSIKLVEYQQYFHHLVIVDPSLTRQIELISKQKLNYIKCIKIVVFLHTWLQSTCVVEDAQSVLEFINFLFKQIATLTQRAKGRRKSPEAKKLSKSVILRETIVNNQQLQLSKQLFILQEVLPAYLYYLQKLISIFDLYNSLKKNFIRAMSPSEIWVLINLLRCAMKVSTKIPSICKFIKKSYRPIAEALTYTLIEDVNYFYPKLYKYCYGEAAKLRVAFFDLESRFGEEQAFKRSVQGMEFMANLLQQVLQINKSLKTVMQQPIVQQLENLYPPKLIDVTGHEFEMVFQLTLLKKSGYPSAVDISMATPKFLISHTSKTTLKTEEKDEEDTNAHMYVFRDISNEGDQVITFRKQKQKTSQKAISITRNRLKQILEDEPKSVE